MRQASPTPAAAQRWPCIALPSWPHIAPALLLQLHQMDHAGGDDGRVSHDLNWMALGLLHAHFGVVAGRKLNLAREYHVLEALDAVLNRRCVGTQHMQTR